MTKEEDRPSSNYSVHEYAASKIHVANETRVSNFNRLQLNCAIRIVGERDEESNVEHYGMRNYRLLTV
jgi:hypothetical protein